MPDTMDSHATSDAAPVATGKALPAPAVAAFAADSVPVAMQVYRDMLSLVGDRTDAVRDSLDRAARISLEGTRVAVRCQQALVEGWQGLSGAWFDAARQTSDLVTQQSAQFAGLWFDIGARVLEPVKSAGEHRAG